MNAGSSTPFAPVEPETGAPALYRNIDGRLIKPRRPAPRMRATLLLLSLLASAGAALAQAEDDEAALCIIFFEPSPDFRTLRVRADLVLSPEQRENITREVDADGDRTVTEAEVAAYETRATQRLGNASEGYGDRMVYLDGLPPESATFRLDLTSWTGPFDQAKLGHATELREYVLQPVPDFAHALSGGVNATPTRIAYPVVETVVFTAPPGWVVHSVRRWSANESEDPYPGYRTIVGSDAGADVHRERTVRISGFETRQPFVVVFAEEGRDPWGPRGGGAPGPSAALAALAVAAAALLAARLRRR